jgi:hypothetical protein
MAKLLKISFIVTLISMMISTTDAQASSITANGLNTNSLAQSRKRSSPTNSFGGSSSLARATLSAIPFGASPSAATKGKGKSCEADSQCSSKEYCFDSSCIERKSIVGEDCEKTANCLGKLICEDGACQRPAKLGTYIL